jgi:hypothetical protein
MGAKGSRVYITGASYPEIRSVWSKADPTVKVSLSILLLPRDPVQS